jgi:dethiobiotin synthase
MKKGLFITGTGTDVGKTLVTAGLVRFFQRNGLEPLAVKPVQSGAFVNEAGGYDSPDGHVYKTAGGSWDPALQCPFMFRGACSPHLAASLEGLEIKAAEIAEKVREVEEKGFLLVEGAGGAMVPLNDKETMIDLMKELGYPVLIVGSNILGSINHVLMTVEVLKHAGLSIAGIITTEPVKEEDVAGMHRDNIETIERFSDVPVLASLNWIPDFNIDNPGLWEEVDRIFDLIDMDLLQKRTGIVKNDEIYS